ncbi:hypothetical protein [Bacillus mesophilum]|uniref:Uncharacterized protein n=1 Tax=Bacillus mesophilum TaxID=1071718 RepID=A0A7V7RP12_9BACI|nr:hypothetical protein [Bacillus mesophilum]KAB2334279.1 hypothetical protein F7732_09420 [Bacillus mesophilum]
MNTLQDQLKIWQNANPLRVKESAPKKPQDKKTEQLKDWEWQELMGANKPTYRRYRGSYRQK